MKQNSFLVTQTVKNEKGFSLLELIMAMGLTVVVLGIVYQSFVSTQKNSRRIEDSIEYNIDALLGDKIIMSDLRSVSISFNQVKLLDDNGLPFYEYYESPNMAGYVRHQRAKTTTRTITLGRGGKTLLPVLIRDRFRGEALYTDPIVAYKMNALPADADINTPAPLSFVGFNQGDYIKTKNEKLLINKQLIAIESSSLMPLTLQNRVRRNALIVGYPNNSGDLRVEKGPAGALVSQIHSHSGVGVMNSLDQFLRNLPPQGSVGSSVRILPVKLILYKARCPSDESLPCEFLREDFATKSEIMMNNNAQKLTLSRSNLTSSVFNVEFSKH